MDSMMVRVDQATAAEGAEIGTIESGTNCVGFFGRPLVRQHRDEEFSIIGFDVDPLRGTTLNLALFAEKHFRSSIRRKCH